MARIVVTSAGTLGDFVPFVALGKRLQQRGHEVVLAVNPAMIPLAARAGLETVPCGRAFGAAEARDQADSFAEGEAPTKSGDLGQSFRRLDLGRTFRELVEVARGADLLVSSSLQGVAPWVHEATGTRWVNATIFAAEFPHTSAPPPPQSDAERAHWRAMFDYRNEVRREVGLSPIADDAWRDAYWSDRLVLVASSTHFSRPWLDDRPQARMTGFWFDDDVSAEWAPGADLVRFLDAGPPPLVLTLSSLPVKDPARLVTLHAEAAAKLGARLIIQQGWAGLDRSALHDSAATDMRDLHFTGHVPHAWLFARCAAVIQHGGIGTTAQALRAGRPMLVEPYCNDQFFNASRVAALGAGAAVDHRLLTPDNLADALARFVLTPAARDRAMQLAGAMAAEDGLRQACDLIEAELIS